MGLAVGVMLLFIYYGVPVLYELLRAGWAAIVGKCSKKGRRAARSPTKRSAIKGAFASLKRRGSAFKDSKWPVFVNKV